MKCPSKSPCYLQATPLRNLPVSLSGFLRGLRLLLRELLFGQNGHPRRHGAGDALLGQVVVVDDGVKFLPGVGVLLCIVALQAFWDALGVLQDKQPLRHTHRRRRWAVSLQVTPVVTEHLPGFGGDSVMS